MVSGGLHRNPHRDPDCVTLTHARYDMKTPCAMYLASLDKCTKADEDFQHSNRAFISNTICCFGNVDTRIHPQPQAFTICLLVQLSALLRCTGLGSDAG
jgi:hypothetical protein